MGVFRPEHRARLLVAVADLLTGATQVYIRAAALDWRILREEEKRDIPANLLRKMLRMKLRTEGVNLASLQSSGQADILSLEVVYLCHRYSLALSTNQSKLEQVMQEILREERNKESHIQYENFPNNSAASSTYFSPADSSFAASHSRLVSQLCKIRKSNTSSFQSTLVSSRSFTANCQPWYHQVQPRKSKLVSSKSSECSLSSSPVTSSSDYEYPRISL